MRRKKRLEEAHRRHLTERARYEECLLSYQRALAEREALKEELSEKEQALFALQQEVARRQGLEAQLGQLQAQAQANQKGGGKAKAAPGKRKRPTRRSEEGARAPRDPGGGSRPGAARPGPRVGPGGCPRPQAPMGPYPGRGGGQGRHRLPKAGGRTGHLPAPHPSLPTPSTRSP